MSDFDKTVELLETLIDVKKTMVNNLNERGIEATENDSLADIADKSRPPSTYILVDEYGNEAVGTYVSEETVFDATANDIREGKTAVTGDGVTIGEKVIPAYHTSEGYRLIPNGSVFIADTGLKDLNKYDFTKFQAIICPYSGSIAESVAADKVAIGDSVYSVNSNVVLSKVTKDSTNKVVNLGITNNSGSIYLLRYFTYKEIY